MDQRFTVRRDHDCGYETGSHPCSGGDPPLVERILEREGDGGHEGKHPDDEQGVLSEPTLEIARPARQGGGAASEPGFQPLV